IPGEDVNEKYKPKYLDNNLINRAPSIALQEAQDEIQNIGKMTVSMLNNVENIDEKAIKKHKDKHLAVDNMYDNVRQYLNKLSEKKLSAKDAERLSVLYDVNRTILKVSTLTESYLEELQKKQ
ncbi:Na/Pi cotransporter family protein, partial [Staphylococcus aureus]|nr:Na/Pi cotransporter family protein [Staphylococcus aureus]